MRKNMMRRSLALVLAMVMVLGLGVTGVQAAPAERKVTFEKLDSIGADLIQNETVIENKNEKHYADTDMVRVTIVLEGEAAIGKVQPGESFLANADAVAYRAELQAQQDKVASSITQPQDHDQSQGQCQGTGDDVVSHVPPLPQSPGL